MTGWAPPVIVMDPPNLFPSILTKPAETDGCVSTDGVRSSESYKTTKPFNGITYSCAVNTLSCPQEHGDLP